MTFLNDSAWVEDASQILPRQTSAAHFVQVKAIMVSLSFISCGSHLAIELPQVARGSFNDYILHVSLKSVVREVFC